MARLTATMPVAQAVACYAGLRRHADSARSQGDPRTLGQLMSDELFTRLASGQIEGVASSGPIRAGTAPEPAGPARPVPGVSVEVGLVMSERTLLRGGSGPGLLTDDKGNAFGQIPAVLARRLVAEADRAWMTRLYAAPKTGELVAMDSHRRVFTGRLRRLILWRDQTCRTPWCEAPIRHADHVRAHAAGGATGQGNAAGLCEACNYAKQATGWRTEISQLRGHVLRITTPTGHQYESGPPRAPGHQTRSLEQHLQDGIDDWDDSRPEPGGEGTTDAA